MITDAFYQGLLSQTKGLIVGESDVIANLANVSALLYHNLPKVNWVGFYLFKDNQLVLGPFQGQPACIRIPLGRGVCGSAAQQRETLRIADVHKFAGHIACDAASNSEIVVPLVINDQLLGVLDIDSPDFNRFSADDQRGIEAIAAVLVEQLS